MMEAGREAARYQQRYVLQLLQRFNEVHRPEICRELGIDIPPVEEKKFLSFVGIGQKSKLHLSKYIRDCILSVAKWFLFPISAVKRSSGGSRP